MADRSFEEKVREELAALQMKPDDAVWVSVEAELHKEKKRRGLIWFFLLAGVAGASCWFYYTGGQKEKTIVTKENAVSTEKQIEKSEVVKTETIGTNQPASSVVNQNNTTDIARQLTTNSGSISKENRFIISGSNNDKKSETVNISKSKTTDLADSSTNDKNVIANGLVAKTDGIIKENEKVGQVQKAVSSATPVIITDSLTGKTDQKENEVAKEDAIIKSTDTISVKKSSDNKKKNKNKIIWSVAINAGASGLQGPLLPGLKQAANFVMSNPSTGIGAGNGGTPVYKQPAVNDAFSYDIQLQAQKQLNKTFSIGASLGYSLFQTNTTVGRKIDSTFFANSFSSFNSNGYYYSNSDSLSYKNQYHFIQLGADVFTSFKLFGILSTRWQLGGGFHILAGSNGLHYDATTGRSFRNNSLLNSVQSYISTGFDFSIGKEPFLFIGPHWEYHISHLAKQATATDHLSLSSIRVSFILPKNKKRNMQR